jgi:hypothetical protein
MLACISRQFPMMDTYTRLTLFDYIPRLLSRAITASKDMQETHLANPAAQAVYQKSVSKGREKRFPRSR